MKKKNPKTQRALDLAAKISNIGPAPTFPPPLDKRIDLLIEQKLTYALAGWAVQKMGKDAQLYLAQATKEFNTLLLWRLIVCDELGKEHVSLETLLSAIEEIPFVFPSRPRKKAQRFDPIRLREDYDKYLKVATRIKGMRGQRKVIAETLVRGLPGIPWDHAWHYAGKGYEAHDIALDYVALLHGMRKKKQSDLLATEALEKHLAIARNPKKLRDWMIKEDKRSEWPLEQLSAFAHSLLEMKP